MVRPSSVSVEVQSPQCVAAVIITTVTNTSRERERERERGKGRGERAEGAVKSLPSSKVFHESLIWLTQSSYDRAGLLHKTQQFQSFVFHIWLAVLRMLNVNVEKVSQPHLSLIYRRLSDCLIKTNASIRLTNIVVNLKCKIPCKGNLKWFSK